MKAVLRAIEKDKAETILGSGLTPISDISFAISPDLSARIMRAGGLDKYFAAEAKARPES